MLCRTAGGHVDGSTSDPELLLWYSFDDFITKNRKKTEEFCPCPCFYAAASGKEGGHPGRGGPFLPLIRQKSKIFATFPQGGRLLGCTPLYFCFLTIGDFFDTLKRLRLSGGVAVRLHWHILKKHKNNRDRQAGENMGNQRHTGCYLCVFPQSTGNDNGV